MQNHKIGEKIILYILAFGLTILLFIAFVLCSISMGLFHNKHILNSLEESGYYSGVYGSVVSGAQDIMLIRGIDMSVLEGVFHIRKVEKEAKKQASATIKENHMVEVETKEIEHSLEENVREYLGKNQLDHGPNQEKELVNLCQQIGNHYKETLHIPFIKYYIKYRNHFYAILKVVFFLLFVGIVILVLLLKKFKGYIAMSIFSASLMVFMGPAWLLGSGTYAHLGVSPKYFYDFLVYYLRWALIVFLIVGCIGSVISISLLAFHIRQAKKL